ncbi:MAG TPA: c-type cytochrome [Burkholderiales bacterium]|nr:c-type cytochrome [Burkholderiales bacterium]
MRTRHWAAVLAALPVSISAALAQDASALRASGLAAICAQCHGTNGRTQGDTVPGLAGRNREQIASLLREFREGKRPATVMHQISKGLTDQQVDTLAAYFAAVKN